MVANIAFFVFLTGALLVVAGLITARLVPESDNDEITRTDWFFICELFVGLIMAIISFVAFAIAGWVDNTDHYGRSMGIIILTAAAVFLIGFMLNRITTPSSRRTR